ncbi:hypothetical protein AZI86_11135 [Bdellovibrio bacteriovorus]|uniref:Integral membrane protein n=1 Tax=Bdellovibrio bacteriovorus TaxID=959 RepID=A0A150WM23_BDEBC|nr:hypothetical protein AZI86_11135 [Bdellovibrio bacteriovorus]
MCDLDNCLIKTDLLYEQWLVLLKSKPWFWVLSFFWLMKGKAFFKHNLATHTKLQPDSLPYRFEVIDLLKRRASAGDVLILASASPEPWVHSVASYLGLFRSTIGSTSSDNRKGSSKLRAIQDLSQGVEFSYIADAPVDLEIWKESQEIVAVNASPSLKNKIHTLNKPTQFIEDGNKSLLTLIVKQLRPHQWIKNVLVFLPALAGHRFQSLDVLTNGFLAFFGFSLTASFVYILNDLLDLSSDRNHHSKKNRPFASGNLPLIYGFAQLPLLLAVSLGIGLLLPPPYLGWILTYLILNLAYSLYLKQSVVVDIIILSLMYTLRIFAGSAATDVPVSEWLLSFSTLFFFSLACIKRYTEIIRSKNKITLDGRGYRQVDHPMVQNLGVGAGLLSILIVLMYLQSEDVRRLYTQPQNLWFATPVLLFWISRIWILTNRDEIHDDPVVFAVKDKISWVCLGILAVIFGISS